MISSSAKVVRLSRLERALRGPMCTDILSPRASMLSGVARMALASLALLLVEASAITLPLDHPPYELKSKCVWQDIPGKQTNMGSRWTPSWNSTSYHQMEREW